MARVETTVDIEGYCVGGSTAKKLYVTIWAPGSRAAGGRTEGGGYVFFDRNSRGMGALGIIGVFSPR